MTAATTTSPLAFACAVISVADLEQALGLWVGHFGMEVRARRSGNDPGLAQAWGLAADGIAGQALLETPGVSDGGLHLVLFRQPGPAVREGAAATDLVPKSIDIAVRDIHARHAELAAAGYRFRSAVGTLETPDVLVHEVHMAAHDELNLVFVEQPARPEPTSPQGYGVAPQIVLITPDNTREAGFLQRLLGLAQVSHNQFSGPAVEQTIGLPAGTRLDIRILGDPARDFGRLELVQYVGLVGHDRYPLARPPARGLLSVTYRVPGLGALLQRADAPPVIRHGEVDCIHGRGLLATATTPAGFRIDLIELM